MMQPERRILLVGQAPGPNTDPDLPLYPVPASSAGGRLQRLTGLTWRDYLLQFDRVNLLPYFPGRTRVRDDAFPTSPAKLAAKVMRPFLAGRVVVFVGRNVANAFGFEVDFHTWKRFSTGRRLPLASPTPYCLAAVVPHPSGRNHWYNKAENRGQAGLFWRHLPSLEELDLSSVLDHSKEIVSNSGA